MTKNGENGENGSELVAIIKSQLPALLLFARQWPHDSPEDVVQESFMRHTNHRKT